MNIQIGIDSEQYRSILEGKQTFVYDSLVSSLARCTEGDMVTLLPYHKRLSYRILDSFSVAVLSSLKDLDKGIVIVSIIWVVPPSLDRFLARLKDCEIKHAPLQAKGKAESVRGVSIE